MKQLNKNYKSKELLTCIEAQMMATISQRELCLSNAFATTMLRSCFVPYNLFYIIMATRMQ